MQATHRKLNETGTVVADGVHICEIAVIPPVDRLPRQGRDISPDRLPFPDCADISPATPISAYQGRNHGD
jgi:hypothetical protein